MLGKVFGSAKIITKFTNRGKVAWAVAGKQPLQKEIIAAEHVAEELGVGIYLRGDKIKVADAFISGVRYEIKSMQNANGVYGSIRQSINRGQATRFVIDGRPGLSLGELQSGLKSLETRGKIWDELIVILGDGSVLRLP